MLILTAGPASAAEDNDSPEVGAVNAIPAPRDDEHIPLISVYRPNYLIFGPEHSQVTGAITSKFQLSLQYRLGSNWYLSYTQRIYWDISQKSEPILDINIQPELSYLWKFGSDASARWNLRDVRVGLAHESNGKDNDSSRSWNRLYLEPHFSWGGLFLEPRVWAILDTDEGNQDIANYAGYADLVFGYENVNQQRFTVTGRHGSEHGSVQLDASLPLPSGRMSQYRGPRLYAQIWTGYGEMLQYYNVYTRAVRIGIEFHP
jgi:phospholipase A1/A2